MNARPKHQDMGAPEASAAAHGTGAAPNKAATQAPTFYPRAPWPDPAQFDFRLANEVRAHFRGSFGDDAFAVESRPFNDETRDRYGHKVVVLRWVAPGVLHKWGVIGDIPGIRRWMNKTTLGGARVHEGGEYMQAWDGPASPPADIPPKPAPGDWRNIYVPEVYGHASAEAAWRSVVSRAQSRLRAAAEQEPNATRSLSPTCPNCRTVVRQPTWRGTCPYCPEGARLVGGCA